MTQLAATYRDDPACFEATVTTKGQITLPQRIRQDVDIREGDRVVFTRLPDGAWILSRIKRDRPNLGALRGFRKQPGPPVDVDLVLEDLRGRRPGEPLP